MWLRCPPRNSLAKRDETKEVQKEHHAAVRDRRGKEDLCLRSQEYSAAMPVARRRGPRIDDVWVKSRPRAFPPVRRRVPTTYLGDTGGRSVALLSYYAVQNTVSAQLMVCVIGSVEIDRASSVWFS
jgi:hypothetical protein